MIYLLLCSTEIDKLYWSSGLRSTISQICREPLWSQEAIWSQGQRLYRIRVIWYRSSATNWCVTDRKHQCWQGWWCLTLFCSGKSRKTPQARQFTLNKTKRRREKGATLKALGDD